MEHTKVPTEVKEYKSGNTNSTSLLKNAKRLDKVLQRLNEKAKKAAEKRK